MPAENLPHVLGVDDRNHVSLGSRGTSVLANRESQSLEDRARSTAAGWFDGLRAGRAATHRDLCLAMAEWELTLDDEGAVLDGCRMDTLLDSSNAPNECADEAWADGYENGFASARAHLVGQVRTQLAQRSLFLSDGLRLITAADASDCIDGLSSFDDPRQEDGPSAIQPRQEGVLSMVVRTFTRRAAIFVLGGTLIMGTLGFVGATQLMRPTPPPPPTWTAPTTWDDDFPFVKQMLLAIDQNAWNLEQQQVIPSPALLTQMQGVFAMSGPTGELGRALYCRWIAERNRTPYLAPLLTQLNPATSTTKTREAIVGCAAYMHAESGSLQTMHRQMLQNYLNSGVEDDETVWERLDRLVSTLVAAGI
jgi:hypothetical protein